jgi:charged multivesicular body protein 4A/B
MDNVQEGIQDAQEIGNVLARGVGGDDIMEDEELLAELNEMEQDELTSTLLEVPKVPSGLPAGMRFDLPEAPTNMPAVAAAEEEDEDARVLRELEASMAM